MAARDYKGPQSQRRVDGSEVFDNLSPRTIAEEQTYPAWVERNKRALDGEFLEAYFYQQVRSGRRCSCWGKDNDPSGSCEVCYGTGIVGGYLKYGTAQWVLDVTAPDVVMNNVRLYTTKGDGPSVFGLVEDATHGEIQATGSFQGHWGPRGTSSCPEQRGRIDTILKNGWPGNDGSFFISVRVPSGAWKPLTDDVLNTLFTTPQRFEIKVELQRPSVNAEVPLFQHLFMRIFRLTEEDTVVKANRPRGTRALTLSELGVLDEWTSERWWFDGTIPNITDLDWFYDIGQQVRWKAVDTDAFRPQNHLLGWDVTVRKVQTFERMSRYPL